MGTPVSTTPTFYGIGSNTVDDEVHGETTRFFSYSYRPDFARDGRFRRTRLGLDQFTLFVHRSQWRTKCNRLIRSGLVVAYRFGHNRSTGRVAIDARVDPHGNTGVWDVVAPPGARPGACYLIDPRRDRNRARAAIILRAAVVAAVRHGHPTREAPAFPGFLFEFSSSRPPVLERTHGLLTAARALHQDLATVPDEALPDSAIRNTFDSLVTRDGVFLHAPSWLFAREPGEIYLAHPQNGTPIPTAGAPEGSAAPGHWVMFDGRWTPEAQRPERVIADFSTLLGRDSLAAWEILVDGGHLPPMRFADWLPTCNDEDWSRFTSTAGPALFPTDLGEGENELVNEWRRRNAIGGKYADDEIVSYAFEDVRRPASFPDEAGVGVVSLSGHAGPETMTFRGYGYDADLYSLRPGWEQQLAPADRSVVERAGRRMASAPATPRRRRRKKAHR